MMGGVLLFGGVSWFLHRTPEWTPAEPAVASQLSTVGLVIWVAAAVGLVFLFTRFRDAPNPAQASMLAILGWALGETVALFGGVVFFLTARTTWFVAGIVALAIALVAFPPPPNH